MILGRKRLLMSHKAHPREWFCHRCDTPVVTMEETCAACRRDAMLVKDIVAALGRALRPAQEGGSDAEA